jgi:UDPglucose--hexose-1-phosphate uridylyltransferase
MIPPRSHAPEFRRDPVTGRWVIVAPERSLRPMALEGAEPRHRVGNEARPCPFCTGQEDNTPSELFAIRSPGSEANGTGWQLRVVPNMYPAVREIGRSERSESSDGLFQRFSGAGRHEVVIESPEHVANPALLPDDLFRDVFIAYRQRLLAHAADPGLRYVSVFKNVGAEAGASLGHCHSQLVALPLVPELVEQELAGSLEYLTRTGRCVFCDLVKFELAEQARVVAETPHLLAITAYAGRFSYETWVLPKDHESRYEWISDSLAAELAGLMKRLVRALDTVLAEPAYNWFLHAAPLRSAELPHYHWHFELMPRTSRPAGFEWGTGCSINAVAPETAAEQLRKAIM